jgi:hypothetical protein
MRIQQLLESRQEPDFPKILKDFLPLAMKEIGIDKLPRIKLELRIVDDEQPTFGKFVSDENIVHLAIEDRHPLDILRTLAHELVHFRQGTEHKLGPTSGETGSPIENEAHEVAGIVMRNFNKLHPHYFNFSAINLKENMDHTKDDRAVPELKAALLAQKEKIKDSDEDGVYNIIDTIMTRIAKSHGISGQKLHDMWVDKYKQIPDTWVMSENFADGRHPEDKGDSKRYHVPTKASVSTLRKVAHQGGRKGQLAHWMANMKAGKAKKNK